MVSVHIHTYMYTHTNAHIHTYTHTVVEDWDLYQRLLDHLFKRHVKTTPDLHPVLMSEPTVSPSNLCMHTVRLINQRPLYLCMPPIPLSMSTRMDSILRYCNIVACELQELQTLKQ